MMCTTKPEAPKRVVVVGGGAAGMMAAVTAARAGALVTVFEKKDRPGKKLRITGKGRCNVTNDCTREAFLSQVPRNPRFLYAALSRFSTEDTKRFFEEAGVALKVERGNRVFPVSDKASDIVAAMVNACRSAGVVFAFRKVDSLWIEAGRLAGVRLADGTRAPADAVIVATGGKSYPLTGSDGDGYRLAEQAGHTIAELSPSLVPIVEKGTVCRSMQGLSLKNVGLTVCRAADNRVVYEDFGEMMFTHFGVTGPMILSASAYLSDLGRQAYYACIDLKPALEDKKLDARLLSDFSKYANRDFINALGDLLPQKIIAPVVEKSGIDARKKVNSVTREERRRLCETIKNFRIELSHFRPIEEAIITRGGVKVTEIDPKTMASKRLPGLYFAGEVLDVDAYTGGFNLQIAFSTGFCAGESAATLDAVKHEKAEAEVQK